MRATMARDRGFVASDDPSAQSSVRVAIGPGCHRGTGSSATSAIWPAVSLPTRAAALHFALSECDYDAGQIDAVPDGVLSLDTLFDRD